MKRRLCFGLSLLCGCVLAAHSSTAGPEVRASATPHDTEATGPRAPQTVPGVGANTEDPRKVLADAGRAVGRLRGVTYEATYEGVGAFATRSSLSAGRVKIEKLGAGNPLTAKLAAAGEHYPAGKAEPEPFRVAFDGKTVFRLRAAEKALMRKTLAENDPAERDFGFVTSLLGAGANQLLMFEYVMGEPFKRQAAADVLEYEGRAAVRGVLCHVVYAEYDRRPDGRVRRERWFLGIKDSLPRKFEVVSADDKGRYGAFVLTLSNLRADAPPDAAAFTVPLPKGYKVAARVPRPRPQLLAVGERAPDFKLADPAGKVHALSDYRGKVVVLDFWATWCGPCVRAMPGLQALHAKYGPRGIEVFGINSWEEGDPAAYFREKGYTYKLLLRGETVAPAYKVGTLPTIYVVGFDGEVVHRGVGLDDNLAAVVEQYLKGRGM